MAIELCREHDVAAVSRELGINRSKLGEKAGLARRAKAVRLPDSRTVRSRANDTDSFVTLSLDHEASSITSEDVDYEWSRPDGAKLRVRSSAAKMTSIVASFLAAEPS